MSKSEPFDLKPTPVLQESCITCGPAVARMILGVATHPESTLAAIIGDFMQQNKDDYKCFYTSPRALAHVLSNLSGIPFRVERRNNPEALTKLIINVLVDHRTPVPVLTEGCGHWVNVSGFQYLGELSQPEITHIYIEDPVNPCMEVNALYCPLDPYCMIKASGEDAFPLKDWHESRLTGCSCGQNEKFICVVPDLEIDESRNYISLFLEEEEPLIIDPLNNLNACVDRAIRLYQLREHELFKIALDGAGVLGWREVLSKRMGSYFLVEVGREEVTALFMLHSKSGSLMSARALLGPSGRILPQSFGGLRRQLAFWVNNRGAKANWEDSLSEDAPLVWEPSLQFRSPYFPYFILESHGKRLNLSLNGAAYRELNPAKA